MGQIEQLSSDQLAHLEQLLAEQQSPTVKRFRPPASPEAFAAVESDLGLALPNEVRQWWEWHDGTDIASDERAQNASIGPSFQFLTTQRAIEWNRFMRELAKEVFIEGQYESWKPTWLAIGNSGVIACDCAVDIDAPVPILDVDYHHTDVPGTVAARSFGEMVRWWIEALESGAWRYKPEEHWWERREELVPPEREQVGLV